MNRCSMLPLHYFYPRPPRGGRLVRVSVLCIVNTISIHALREEGDMAVVCPHGLHLQFLSTPSARRATFHSAAPLQTLESHFYPRPPRGGRRFSLRCSKHPNKFLSTPSARRATSACTSEIQLLLQFLSTPSARRATFRFQNSMFLLPIFLSTPSARRATAPLLMGLAKPMYFYPRPPRGGRRRASCS